jgi:hypothetical protein
MALEQGAAQIGNDGVANVVAEDLTDAQG